MLCTLVTTLQSYGKRKLLDFLLVLMNKYFPPAFKGKNFDRIRSLEFENNANCTSTSLKMVINEPV